MTIRAGINGFGRFGLHLLNHYLDRAHQCGFRLDFIHDDGLTLDHALAILHDDRYVRIPERFSVSVEGARIHFAGSRGVTSLTYTHAPVGEPIPWRGEPDYFLECSGRNIQASNCHPFLMGRTRLVVISATSWDAERTLIYGFNHAEALNGARVISYGSCTVNAFVPLGQYLHQAWGIRDCDVQVIHNVQAYRLGDPATHTLVRRFCNLEKFAPMVLPFLHGDNFKVNYTVVPYGGVSLLDFRFRLARPPLGVEPILRGLEEACREGGALSGLYAVEADDRGPEAHVCSPFSTVFVRDKARLVGDNLYLQGYFDNENSAARYYDLVNHLALRQD